MPRLRLFFFIGRYYMRYFLVIFIALELFFVGIDSLQYADNFAESANLVVLFFAYDFMYAVNFTLPISLLLAMAICYLTLIKSSQYTALLALGYSRRRLLRPVLLLSLALTCLYIGLNATPFAYAREKVATFFKDSSSTPTKDLFVKYNQSYVFFGTINSLAQANNVRVFEVNKDEKKLESFIQAKKAYFENDAWVLQEAKTQTLPKSWNLGNAGIASSTKDRLQILEKFNPKVLDSFAQANPSISIIDALDSLSLLRSQKISTDKARSILYSLILVPLFVPFVAIIIGYYTPSLARYTNLYLLGFCFIIFALLVWGLFFALSQFAITDIIYPEIAVPVPIAILASVAIAYYARLNKKAD